MAKETKFLEMEEQKVFFRMCQPNITVRRVSMIRLNKYGLKKLAVDGWVYLEIRKGMYGLKQASILENQLLQKRLKPFGYHPA
jgi:hypothetical protein